MKRLWAALPDRYLGLAFANLGTMVPVLDSVFRHLMGHDAGGGWFHVVLPGIAMAVGGQFGNCMVISASLDARSPLTKGTRVFLFCWSMACLAAALYLVTSYMLARYLGDGLEELLPMWALALLFCSVFMMAEGPTFPLLLLSRSLQSAQVAVERSVQDAAAGTSQRILLELLSAGDAGMTAASLADALGVGVATIGNHLKKLAKGGEEAKVHSVMFPGSAAAVWKIGAAP